MKPTALVLALVLTPVVASGQSTPRFELADVHMSVMTPVMVGSPAGGGVPRDGVYRIWRASMVDLIRMAYGVDADKITGGPHWLELDRFDIVARVPPGTNRETARPMLQTLLAERFGLVLKHDAREFPVYALVRGDRDLRLRDAAAGTPSRCQQSMQSPGGGGRPIVTHACQSTSMAALAQRVSTALGGKPVTDVTGIAGLQDFDVALPLPVAGAPDVQGVSDGVERSTGLKLEQRSVVLPVAGVERVDRTPSPNSPDVAAAFPSGLEPEFDVSVIKPSPPGAQPRRQILPTGQLNGTAVSVRQLLGLAYQLPDEAPIVGPKALDSPLWDVIARASSQPLNPEETDAITAISSMMRRLLAREFRLKARFEDRPMEAPALVVAGAHKLRKSEDPDARTRCTQSSAVGVGVPATVLTCQNISLSEFAERLQRLDPQTFTYPVADQTGTAGRWNISLTFTPALLLRAFTEGVNAGRAAAAAQSGGNAGLSAASDPISAISIAQAISSQLGLRIEMRRRPVPVLIVDSMDDKPLGN